MTDEETAKKTAAWLERLHAWRKSGLTLAAYVRREQLRDWEAYEWRGRLRRQGLWAEPTDDKGSGDKGVVRFARVSLKEPQIAVRHAPLLLRVGFSNGRSAELQLLDVSQLGEVFATLERLP